MATPAQNSPEMLREEILAEARRQGEEMISRAQHERENRLAKAAAEADTARAKRLDQARVEAARRKGLMLATVPIEAARLRAARTEALLESVHEEIRQRLAARDHFEYSETVVALAVEAVKQMHGSAFIVKLSTADHAALGDGLAETIARRVGRPLLNIALSHDATLKNGGVIIEDADGRQVWDNRLLARLERMWPELRRQIAVQTGLVIESKPAGNLA